MRKSLKGGKRNQTGLELIHFSTLQDYTVSIAHIARYVSNLDEVTLADRHFVLRLFSHLLTALIRQMSRIRR